MGAAFTKILGYVVAILTALPQLIAGIESLFGAIPKSGAKKWIAVELALSQSITMVAQQVAQLAPNTSVEEVTGKIAKFSKAVNDAFVVLCNELGIFEH